MSTLCLIWRRILSGTLCSVPEPKDRSKSIFTHYISSRCRKTNKYLIGSLTRYTYKYMCSKQKYRFIYSRIDLPLMFDAKNPSLRASMRTCAFD